MEEEERGEGKGGLVKSWDSPHEVPPPAVTVVDELPDPDPAASHRPTVDDDFMSALGVDMVREVLVRLPVKPLFRFMCISKKYHDMISDAAFKRWYRRRRLRLNSPPLAAGLVYQTYDNVGGGHSMDDDIPTLSMKLIRSSAADNGKDDDDLYHDGADDGCAVVDMRMNYLTHPVIVVGSCNGLLLLSETWRRWRYYYICNPITRQWVTLPPHPWGVYSNCSAMLYIPSLEEEEEEEKQVVEEGGPRHYKVILLSLTVRSVGINSHTVDVVIFSSEIGEWMGHRIQCPVACLPRHSIALEGALYHLYQPGDLQHVGAVVYLAKDNCMHLLELPSDDNDWTCLGMSGGSLHHAAIRELDGCCRIWVLLPPQGGGGGGEWSLKHVVYMFPCIPRISHRDWWPIEPLGFHPTEPHLLFIRIRGCCESGDMVLSCDTQRADRLKWVCFHNSCPDQVSFNSFFPYVSPAWPTCIPQANN